MKNKDLEAQANSILRLFEFKDMDLLYHEMVDFLYIWDGCQHTDKLMQEHLEGNLEQLRLLRSAIVLSRIADLFGRKFSKISKKFPSFWRKCEQVAENLRLEVNEDADKKVQHVQSG